MKSPCYGSVARAARTIAFELLPCGAERAQRRSKTQPGPGLLLARRRLAPRPRGAAVGRHMSNAPYGDRTYLAEQVSACSLVARTCGTRNCARSPMQQRDPRRSEHKSARPVKERLRHQSCVRGLPPLVAVFSFASKRQSRSERCSSSQAGASDTLIGALCDSCVRAEHHSDHVFCNIHEEARFRGPYSVERTRLVLSLAAARSLSLRVPNC